MRNKDKLNFNEPFVLEAIFREDPKTEVEQHGEERMEEIAHLWIDIVGIRTYPYNSEDHWEQYKDHDKFYITFRETGTFLVLGSFKQMLKLWKEYCRQEYGKNTEEES